MELYFNARYHRFVSSGTLWKARHFLFWNIQDFKPFLIRRLLMMNIVHPTLQVKNLTIQLLKQGIYYPIVEDLSFDVAKGETLAIIGESGSGKSVTALALMHLLPRAQFTVSGEILFHGQDISQPSKNFIKTILGKKIAMIFQNPQASLNPVFTIEQQFQELIDTHLELSPRQAKDTIIQALEQTGFHNPAACLKLYPHELSGGMLQRVCIAMALLTSPDILIADEPTTALDVSVQFQILQLLKQLQEKTGMSLLIITHNMGVVAETADRVFVIYSGRMVECAPVHKLFDAPSHPYTQDLLNSRPTKDQNSFRTFITIPGQPPHYSNRPTGCAYHPRCKHTENKCSKNSPCKQTVCENHTVSCWLYE